MFPLKDANPRHGPVVVIWLILAANIVLFIRELSLNEAQIVGFINTFGFVPALFFSDPIDEAYRLISSLFLHGGFMHIVGNMFFLMVFGDNIEDFMGPVRFTLFYLIGGVVATLAHSAFALSSTTALIGASGAISALLGAYIRLFPRQKIRTYIVPIFFVWLPAWLYLGYWGLVQVMQALSGAVVEGNAAEVAWWAHVGGFVFGLITVRFFLKKDKRVRV